MPGPPPKDPARRVRRNADQFAFAARTIPRPTEPPDTELHDDLLPEGQTWHPATRRWWDAMRANPLAADWLATDWEELRIVAVLHHRMLSGARNTANVGGEIRQRTGKFGATPADRQRLRISTATAEAAERRVERPTASGMPAWRDEL